MVISGTVENIVFRNEENGFTVIDFYADGRLINAVGIFPVIQEGEALTLAGEMKVNSKFGEQLQVTDVGFDAPTDLNGLVVYLSSGLFRGVGEVTARVIVEKFGLKTLDIIANDPKRLTEIRGIGAVKAAEIADCYKQKLGMQNTILFLQKYGITLGHALKIYKCYGEDAQQLLLDNPYRLIDDVEGIGFITADKIAAKLGVQADSDFRVMAGITHVLKEAASRNGHTCLPEEELIAQTAILVNVDEPGKVEDCLQIMLFNCKINFFKGREGGGAERAYALALNHNTENAVAASLIRIIDGAESLDIDCDKRIAAYEEQNGIQLHAAQRDAIKTAVTRGVMVITGGPGTGKTTIIKCILELLTERGLKVALTAPTGRAAKRMTEASGREAKTIHRLLGAEFRDGRPVYNYTELNPLEYDALVIDEISMADIYVFNALLKAVPKGGRIIMVGDKDQLPSVSAGNILSDIIGSGEVPVICLTEIYRQDADSLIIVNAHRINNGMMPEINNRSRDFFVDNKGNDAEIAESVISLLSERIPRHFGIGIKDIQVLSPVKRGLAGVENLNKRIQEALNPPSGKEIIVNGTVFRTNDKVMHTVNNYSLKWERRSPGYEEGEGVFNGDIGYIRDIGKGGDMLIEFEDGRFATYGREEQEELILAYAVSVHKSQGSEFSAVILALSNASYMLMQRNLLYTAVTRAKNVAVIVGSYGNIKRMVDNDSTAKRYTMLREFIWANRKKTAMLS